MAIYIRREDLIDAYHCECWWLIEALRDIKRQGVRVLVYE